MSRLIAAFLLTAPLIIMVGADDMANLPQTVWLQAAVPLLLTVWSATSRAPMRHGWFRTFAPILAFLAWAALSFFWATDAFAAEGVLFRWLAAAGLAFLIANTVETGADVRRPLVALYVASILVSTIGLLQHLGGFDGIPQAVPPAGTMGNKNIAAGFVAVMAPVGVMSFLAATTPGIASAFALSLGVALAFVMQTGCRAAGLALAAEIVLGLGFVAFRMLQPGPVRAKWASVCAGAAVFVLLVSMPPAPSSAASGTSAELLAGMAHPLLRFLSGAPATAEPALADLSPGERAERSVAIRLGVWRNSLGLIRDAPLMGVGLGNFQVHYPRFARSAVADGTRIDEKVDSAHNDYVQVLAEMGLLGAGLLGWVLLSAGRSILAVVRAAPAEDRGPYVASALGLVGLLLLAAVSPTMGQPVALVVAATFLGVTARPPLARLQERGEGRPVRGYDLAAFAAAATFVVASVWGATQLRADRHVLTMAIAEGREDWPAVVREGLIARRLNPRRTDTRFGIASGMLRLGQASEAARMLEELVAVDPYNANALGNLGMAYAASGDVLRAASCYERVLLLRPDDNIARSQLKRVMASERTGNSPS